MTWWGKSHNYFLLPPNLLSLSRGVIGILLPFLIFQTDPSFHIWAFALFIFGAITDYADGHMARSLSMVTAFGKFIDPTMDKILILVPLAAFSQLGFYSPWWVVFIVAREILVTFLRIGWAREGSVIAAEQMGKVKLVSQVAVIVFAFSHLLRSNGVSWMQMNIDWVFWTQVSLILAFILTLSSGLSLVWHNRGLFKTEAFAQFTCALGVGLFPRAPGTWGSALGLALAWLCHWNAGLYTLVFLLITWTGYWSFSRLKTLKQKDPSFVVVDETCGMMLSMVLIPFSWSSAVLGFILFRFFDIVKPFPLKRLEKLDGFNGILFDDLGAGIYSWLILYFLFR